MSSASTSTSTKCAFLELPAELRNRIHELTLIEEEHIDIDADTFAQPAWTRTCRQIREEALPIYYCQNAFRFLVADGEPTPLQKFHLQAEKFTVRGMLLDIIFDFGDVTDKLSWSKSRGWLQAYHDRRAGRLLHNDNHAPEACDDGCALATAFGIVAELRGIVEWA